MIEDNIFKPIKHANFNAEEELEFNADLSIVPQRGKCKYYYKKKK